MHPVDECPIFWCGDYIVAITGEVFSTKSGTRRRLRPKPHSAGYAAVTLCRYGERRDFLIHRLVAMHFIPNPYRLEEVNHVDGDKRNNSAGNLEWVDHSGNTKHSWDHGLRESQRLIVARTNTDRCSRPVVGIGKDGEQLHFASMTAASVRGFSHSKISLCVSGKRKTHKGFRWQAA